MPDTTDDPENAAAAVDEDGLLRYGGRWVALTDAQVPVIQLLVERLGSVVRNEDILAAYGSGGGTPSESALRPLVHRLRRRVAAVGLELHVIRRRGVLLEPANAENEP